MVPIQLALIILSPKPEYGNIGLHREKIFSIGALVNSKPFKGYLGPYSRYSMMSNSAFLKVGTESVRLENKDLVSKGYKFKHVPETQSFMEGCDIVLGRGFFVDTHLIYDPVSQNIQVRVTTPNNENEIPSQEYNVIEYKLHVSGEHGWKVKIPGKGDYILDFSSRMSVFRSKKEKVDRKFKVLIPENRIAQGELEFNDFNSLLPAGSPILATSEMIINSWDGCQGILSVPSVPFKAVIDFQRSVLKFYLPENREKRVQMWLSGITGIGTESTKSLFQFKGQQPPEDRKLKIIEIDGEPIDDWVERAANSGEAFNHETGKFLSKYFSDTLSVRIIDDVGELYEAVMRSGLN
jgi:hypothetical protein